MRLLNNIVKNLFILTLFLAAGTAWAGTASTNNGCSCSGQNVEKSDDGSKVMCFSLGGGVKCEVCVDNPPPSKGCKCATLDCTIPIGKGLTGKENLFSDESSLSRLFER